MNLPHVKNNLGPKSLRAITQPVISRRGGRQSGEDLAIDFLVGQTVPVPDPSSSWLSLQAQRKNLLGLPYQRLLHIALDLSPEVNKGLHDFLRYVNPGYILENENEQALRSTEQFIGTLATYYGSFNSHVDSLWSGVFLTGGLFPELVLDPASRYPVDLVFNDPATARFRREPHAIRGNRWRLGQETRFGFKYLDDDPLIKYLGVDRLTDNPYGRPLVGPAVYSSILLLGLILDLQRAVANLGLSRIDYELDAEELLKLIDRNPDIAGDDEATAQFINEHIEAIRSVLANLDPDSDYVHLSTVKVNYAKNPVTMNLNGMDTIVDTLQRNVVNGFKGISALINVLDSTTETHIRSQLEFFVSSVQSLQEEVAAMFEEYFDIGNQVQGIQGETSFKFRRQRTADRKAEADIRKTETETTISKLDAGVIDEMEARDEIDSFTDALRVGT